MTDHERFLSKVDRRADDICWPWLGSCTSDGHGVFHMDKMNHKAHRAAWFFRFGEWPTGWVLHSCDVAACCNPAHLRIGTHAENMADMIRRNRRRSERIDKALVGQPVIKRSNAAKLTPAQVADIRSRYAAGGISQNQLAREYGTSQANIGFIIRGVTWRGVA